MCCLLCILYDVYNLRNSVKLPPKRRKWYFRDPRTQNFPRGHARPRLDVSCAFVPRLVPPVFLPWRHHCLSTMKIKA